MRSHAAIGGELVGRIDAFAHLAPAVRASHERWDGGGYPDGLAGEQIPLAARIIAACDTYDAIVTDRPYRPARTPREACEELAPGRRHAAGPARSSTDAARRSWQRAAELSCSAAAVVLRGRLAQALAAPGHQRGGDVAPVAPRVVPRQRDARRARAARSSRRSASAPRSAAAAEWCLRMYRSRLRASSTIRRSGTASVESCSWWIADAPAARTRCASRRRAGGARSRPRRSTRRSRGPGSPTCAAASRRTSSAEDWHQSTSRVRAPLLWTV